MPGVGLGMGLGMIIRVNPNPLPNPPHGGVGRNQDLLHRHDPNQLEGRHEGENNQWGDNNGNQNNHLGNNEWGNDNDNGEDNRWDNAHHNIEELDQDMVPVRPQPPQTSAVVPGLASGQGLRPGLASRPGLRGDDEPPHNLAAGLSGGELMALLEADDGDSP